MKRHITATLRLGWTAALAAALLGCASPRTAPKEPTVRDDFLEYRQLVVLGIQQVNATLDALNEVEVQARAKPRPAYQAFAKAVQRLEIDSIRVRARTAAMRARGSAYFDAWEKYLATVPREDVRRLAEEHRADLRRSYDEIQAAAQQAREIFRPFLTDLQKLRAVLEAEPDLAHIDAQKALVLTAQDKGRQVLQALDRILAEMNTVTAMLTPPSAASKS